MRSIAIALMAAILSAPAAAKGINPGEYEITGGYPYICLKSDGTWYGVSFNISGRWINDPSSLHDKAVIFGNYAVNGSGSGYGNDTMTIIHTGDGLAVDWYDWYDDLSYQNFFGADGFVLVKRTCDAPFTGQNTHAASQRQ